MIGTIRGAKQGNYLKTNPEDFDISLRQNKKKKIL